MDPPADGECGLFGIGPHPDINGYGIVVAAQQDKANIGINERSIQRTMAKKAIRMVSTTECMGVVLETNIHGCGERNYVCYRKSVCHDEWLYLL